MNFANAAKIEANFTNNAKLTENGALALRSTRSSLVDLFATIGALRSRSDRDIINAFESAFAEDKLLALKMIFYARNVRGGLGERRTFRILLRHLAKMRPELVRANMAAIPLFGRFDDLYELVGTHVETDMYKFIRRQFIDDLTNMKRDVPISLLGKWLKSANASSLETRELGRATAKALNMSERMYRKTLTQIRNYLNVVEHNMSAQEWYRINYEQVPSVAMKNYRKAFARNDNQRFSSFMAAVENGDKKINSDTLFPYDLVEQYIHQWHPALDRVIEAQWKALPNYVNGEHNVLVMADVSGSMIGRPMATSIGLAIYFAERNKGDFKNLYMTFTNKPHYIEINPNDTLLKKVNQVMKTDVGYNTNLELAFLQILTTGIANRISNENMPRAIAIISDMEIDKYMKDARYWTFLDEMERRFNQAGYSLPSICMWNCAARNDTFHASAFHPNVQMFSGNSAVTFKDVLNSIGKTPYQAMVDTLNNPMYNVIHL